MRAFEVFRQSDADVTKKYYEDVQQMMPHGPLAVALFRAQKRSTRAKEYRRSRWRREAYDVKNWSISEVCRILQENGLGIAWGWKRDDKTVGFEWVLYVDLPGGFGQVSFHSADRGAGPDYPGEWDGRKNESTQRICSFCDWIRIGSFPRKESCL